jgi:hypothetical protein
VREVCRPRLRLIELQEVRVPLNTALLAAQNLAGTNAIQREHEIEFNALEGSLNMMSKVLNDVLDFNRMVGLTSCCRARLMGCRTRAGSRLCPSRLRFMR